MIRDNTIRANTAQRDNNNHMGRFPREAKYQILSFRGALRAEESLRSRASATERFLASLGMTTRGVCSANILAFAFVAFLAAALPSIRVASALSLIHI